MKNIKIALWSLRIGIAFTFLYAAVDSFINPDMWIGFLPPMMQAIVPGEILLPIFSVYEIVLGLWLLSGWKSFYPALLSGATMIGIIVSSPSQFIITFRDVAILGAAVALAALSKEE
ncbi:MAG: hypothetical protein Q7S83_03285 [bacterium]|nr:hypothetical protein [bacterium]